MYIAAGPGQKLQKFIRADFKRFTQKLSMACLLYVAKELLQTHVTPSEYRAPNYKFTPVNIDELRRDDQNFVGHVGEDPGNVVISYS